MTRTEKFHLIITLTVTHIAAICVGLYLATVLIGENITK